MLFVTGGWEHIKRLQYIMYPQKPDGQTKNNLLPNVFLIARRDASNQVGPWNNLIQSCLSFKTFDGWTNFPFTTSETKRDY